MTPAYDGDVALNGQHVAYIDHVEEFSTEAESGSRVISTRYGVSPIVTTGRATARTGLITFHLTRTDADGTPDQRALALEEAARTGAPLDLSWTNPMVGLPTRIVPTGVIRRTLNADTRGTGRRAAWSVELDYTEVQ